MSEQAIRVNHEVVVPVTPDQAFRLFTEQLSRWWPQEYTWSQDALETIGIEPKKDGRCTELGPHGFQVDWGRVLVWSPPEQLTLAWHIGPDRVPHPNPEEASRVDFLFQAEVPSKTRLVMEHRDFQNHGDAASEYRDAMASDYGWPFIIGRFQKVANA